VGTQHRDSGESSFGEILGLKEEIGKIQVSIAEYETGKKLNIAIIAGTLAGKTVLLDEIEKINQNRATRIAFPGIVRDIKEIFLSDDTKRVVLLDNCHYLYMRKPGGFDIFYEFLDMISSQDQLFITTWNLYSWRYLKEAFGIERYFPVQVFIPSLDKKNLRLFILKSYGKEEIRFYNVKEPKKEPLIYIAKYPLEISSLGRKILIPALKINFSYLKKLFRHEEETQTAEERVFEKIYLESKGNPGIAWRVWELGLDYPAIKPEDIGQFSFDIELEYEEAFVLSLILSYQALKKTEIAEMIGSEFRADEILFQLLSRELVFKDEADCYRVKPEALQSIIAYMKKLRLVW
jgi:hypothetical protein